MFSAYSVTLFSPVWRQWWLTWCLKQLYNNRCILHIKMTLWHRHAYFQIGNESIDLNFKNCIFGCVYGARVEAVFSYTLTGAVSIEMTKNVVRVKSLFMKGSALGVHTLCTFLFFFPQRLRYLSTINFWFKQPIRLLHNIFGPLCTYCAS